MSPRGETITMRSLSPCPDSSWSRFLTASEQFLPMLPPLTLLLVLLRLCSSSQLLAQRHFSLPWAATAFCCPSCCDFSWGLIYLHKLARDKVAQKWEWGQRRVIFNTPPSMTSHLTVGMLFHLFLPTTAFFKVLVRDICCKRLQTLWTLCQTPANLKKIVHHSWMFILWWKCNSTHIQSGTLCPSADGGFQPLFQRVTFNAAGWPSSHGFMLCGTAHPSDVLQLFS